MTLTEFLLARIAEDEELARWAASMESDRGTLRTWRHDSALREVIVAAGDPNAADALRRVGFEVTDIEAARMSRPHGPVVTEGDLDVAEHIARHDPARVLAECEAKRQVVDLATNQHTSGPEYSEVVRLLAAVYANHPDYQQTWRP